MARNLLEAVGDEIYLPLQLLQRRPLHELDRFRPRVDSHPSGHLVDSRALVYTIAKRDDVALVVAAAADVDRVDLLVEGLELRR